MAKISGTEKWKKRTLTALSVALAASLSAGVFAACAPKTETPEEKDPVVSPTDSQLLRNGNFEFYNDNNLSDRDKKYNVINSPSGGWSFTSGSPSSNAASGIINTSEWDYFTKSGGYKFQSFKKNEDDTETVETFRTIDEAVAHWKDDNVSAYDRIKFYDIFEEDIKALDAESEAAKLFKEYNYSVDFDDVKDLDADLPEGVTARPGAEESEKSILMIHNDKKGESEELYGTAQYYTSSTTITLSAGTSAKVSVWVKTDKLSHYKDVDVEARAGAYIAVTNKVGGNTQDQMQIYNINTKGEWKEYTVYVRASTFASTTFNVVLGLGQGSSDDRYYYVDGYAFFDDVHCEVISNSDFASAVLNEDETFKTDVCGCKIDYVKTEKQFPVDEDAYKNFTAFALDLYAGFPDNDLLENVEVALTEEKSGSKPYSSEDIYKFLNDDKTYNYTGNENGITTVEELARIAQSGDQTPVANYVKSIYENDFDGKFPFTSKDLVMLLSGNGAAYTAKVESPLFTLQPETRMLISFFAKTSAVESGLTGAGAAVVDGGSKTTIKAFDTTKLNTVDIDSKSDDETKKDIYKGWAQCFFFLENDTDSPKTFSLELTLGPTTILGTNRFSYGDGYAAFANFEAKQLTKTEYGYVSTGDRAVKVSLTGGKEESKRFDTVSAVDEKTLENGPAIPANFRGVLGGSDFIIKDGKENKKPDSIVSGLLNSKYAKNYFASDADWRKVLDAEGETADQWWQNMFGNARQPLVIINGDNTVSYGYFAMDVSTISADAYQRISMRVKATPGAVAYIYLTDTTVKNQGKGLSPKLPSYTYWYDDKGNIVDMDPSDESFKKDGKVLYELQENGLYKKADSNSDTYYANLHNYDTDKEGNLIAKSGEIVFFLGEDGKTFYAYRTENKDGSYKYETPVTNLPTDIARSEYDFTNVTAPVAEMKVVGTGDWVTVSFYVHTGGTEKNYRVEVWSGNRNGNETNPAGSYVIFDNFSSTSASSNYSTLLDEKVQAVKDKLNGEKTINDEGYLSKEDDLPSGEGYDWFKTLYYTFTFFDSASYIRYDETQDEEKLGNPWGSYKQSGQNEQLVHLFFMEDAEGEAPTYNFFLDYSPIETTVTPDDLGANDNVDQEDPNAAAATTNGDVNIWLLISSGSLAIVLILVIVIVIVRRLLSKKRKPQARKA